MEQEGLEGVSSAPLRTSFFLLCYNLNFYNSQTEDVFVSERLLLTSIMKLIVHKVNNLLACII
jgi:hypothetical protein